MNTNLYHTLRFSALILMASLLFSSCDVLNMVSLAGHMAGGDVEDKSFSYDYTTDLKSKSQIIEHIKAVGTGSGWQITSETPDYIGWKVTESNRADEYFGKYSTTMFHTSVFAYSETDKMVTMRLTASISGNYNEATKEKTDALIADFTTKLSQRLSDAGYTFTKKE